MRRATLTLAIALIGGLLMASPASSAPSGDPPDTPRINFFTGAPDQFAAGEPFHVQHGWFPQKGQSPGDMHFYLFVDGEQVEPDTIGCFGGATPPCRGHLFDFSEGLAPGEHEFIAMWVAPCEVWNEYSNCVKDDAQMTHPDLVKRETIEFVDVPYLGSWIAFEENGPNYLNIHPDGGFDLLDPTAVVCGADPVAGGSHPGRGPWLGRVFVDGGIAGVCVLRRDLLST